MNWSKLGHTIKWIGFLSLGIGVAVTIFAYQLAFDVLIKASDPFTSALIVKAMSSAGPKMIHTGTIAFLAGYAIQKSSIKDNQNAAKNQL